MCCILLFLSYDKSSHILSGMSTKASRIITQTFIFYDQHLIRTACSSNMSMEIFFPGSDTSPDMSLLLVYIQYLANFYGQSRIDHFQAFYAILMYRTLTDPEFLSCLPHRSLCFNNISCDLNCTFFNIILHCQAPEDAFLQCMQRLFQV